jgi:hypothetical protein
MRADSSGRLDHRRDGARAKIDEIRRFVPWREEEGVHAGALLREGAVRATHR